MIVIIIFKYSITRLQELISLSEAKEKSKAKRKPSANQPRTTHTDRSRLIIFLSTRQVKILDTHYLTF